MNNVKIINNDNIGLSYLWLVIITLKTLRNFKIGEKSPIEWLVFFMEKFYFNTFLKYCDFS